MTPSSIPSKAVAEYDRERSLLIPPRAPAMTLAADVARCRCVHACGQRYQCARYTVAPAEGNQAFADFSVGIERTHCEAFIDNRTGART